MKWMMEMEKVITRQRYLDRLISMVDTEFIKIITGVRRSGKSYLLLMLKDYLLKQKISEDRIVYLNFEFPKYRKLLSYDSLYNIRAGENSVIYCRDETSFFLYFLF